MKRVPRFDRDVRTGKSTLLAELATCGYWTVDTDYGDYSETVGGEGLDRSAAADTDE